MGVVGSENVSAAWIYRGIYSVSLVMAGERDIRRSKNADKILLDFIDI